MMLFHSTASATKPSHISNPDTRLEKVGRLVPEGKSFLFLAMLPTFYQFIFVFISGKYIYPMLTLGASVRLCPTIILSVFCQLYNTIIFYIVFCTAVNPCFWFKHKTTYHRILMNVPNYLRIHLLSRNFYWLVMLLPKLPTTVITILFTSPFKHPLHPFPPSFLCMLFY